MKIGVSYWMFEGGLEGKKPIEEAMEEAKACGFDAIELAVASEGVLTHQTTQAECNQIVATAAKIGIEIASVASGQSWSWSPTASDAATRKNIIDFTHKALQITQWLGSDAYLFVPGAVDVFFLPDAEVVPYDLCYQRALEAIKQLIPTAEKVGVALAIENVWNKFLLSPLEMRAFIDGFNSSRVGAYFDVGNVLLTGYPEQWIKILRKRIKRVHIKDCLNAQADAAKAFVDLAEGDVDFAVVKKALDEIGYDGYVTAEVLPYAPGRLEHTAKVMSDTFK